MNRFLLFSGWTFYATGGWHDCNGMCDTLKIACQLGLGRLKRKEADWWHVVDLDLGVIVAGSKRQPYGNEDYLDPKLVVEDLSD